MPDEQIRRECEEVAPIVDESEPPYASDAEFERHQEFADDAREDARADYLAEQDGQPC